MVPPVGLEPTRSCEQQILSPYRANSRSFPMPPNAHGFKVLRSILPWSMFPNLPGTSVHDYTGITQAGQGTRYPPRPAGESASVAPAMREATSREAQAPGARARAYRCIYRGRRQAGAASPRAGPKRATEIGTFRDRGHAIVRQIRSGLVRTGHETVAAVCHGRRMKRIRSR